MKKFLLLALMSANLFASRGIDADGAYKLNRASKLDRDLSVGSVMHSGGWLKGQWSYADQGGGATQDLQLHDHEGVAVTVPANGIVTDCLIDVVTPVTAAAISSASLALSFSSVGDLKASSFAHVTGYNARDRITCLPVGTAATAIRAASEAVLKIRIGSEPLTAGKIDVWVQYLISD